MTARLGIACAAAAALFAPVLLAAQDAPARGPEGAVLEIVEFSDFECPFCAQALPVLDALLAAHPDDVRLVFRHFPLPIHEHAARAAQAAIEADRQGAFWRYHDHVFANQAAMTDADLVAYAERMGLDAGALERALAEGTHQARMHADMELGMSLAVRGTPTFFVNGFRLEGVPPLWVFERALAAFRSGIVGARPLRPAEVPAIGGPGAD
ncbi:MAG TPA: DsbA family protein [Gemmatimonadota bacterium]|jgi:protein-disulfide isomerase